MPTNTLKIFKTGSRSFVHRHNDMPATDFSISDFEVSFDGSKFKIIENDGATRFPYNVPNITVIDLTGAGTPEVYLTAAALEARLRQLNYTPYVMEMSPGVYLVNGTGTTVTGIGTFDDPYNVNVAGGSGGSPHNQKLFYAEAEITVPAGFTGIITNLTDINAEVTFNVIGTALTVTGGASNGDVLLINGQF